MGFDNIRTQFQTDHPLSPRKFWKKIIERIFVIGVVVFFIDLIVVFTAFFIAVNNNTNFFLDAWILHLIWISLGSFLVLFSGYAWYVKRYISNYRYDVGQDFIVIKKGEFAPTEIHVQYKKIQDVYVDQDILDRVMGIYDVHIASATASSGIEAHIDGVDGIVAKHLKEQILNRIRSISSNEITLEEQQLVHNWKNEISNVTYPISSRWIAYRVLSSFAYGILLSMAIFTLLITRLGISFLTESFVMALILLFVFFVICHFAYTFFWKKYFSFIFHPKHIVSSSGVISHQERYLSYTAIQDVSINQNFLEKIFGVANIFIQNAANNNQGMHNFEFFNGIKLPGQDIAKANEIAEALKSVLIANRRERL